MVRIIVSVTIALIGQAPLAAAEPAESAVGDLMPAGAGGQLLSVLAALVAVLVLFGGIVWLMRRVQAGSVTATRNLEVIGGLTFGMRDRIVLIRAGEQHVLVAITGSGMTALSSWQGESLSPERSFATALEASDTRTAQGRAS